MLYSTKTYSRTKGFTLIELLVVIAIIGILASVVLASLNDSRNAAKDAEMLSTMRQFQNALEMYYIENDRYPNSASWDCVGTYADNRCWNNRSNLNVNTNFNNEMAPYFDMSAFRPVETRDISNSYREGAMYIDRNGGDGYELAYTLQRDGRSSVVTSCPIGFRRHGNSVYLACTICGGDWDGSDCRDR